MVYRVEQVYLGIELALKTINKSSLTENAVRRFQGEARAVFALNHPNVISVHDFGLLDDETPFLAMEIVEGTTLSNLLKTRSLTVEEAIPIFIQVCAGLAHAHDNGVIHRDIKPGNIMLLDNLLPGTEGSVKILDFGIAKLVDSEENQMQSLTRTGEVFGSPLYMSPEQCTGSKVDNRADIYSLGCVIFEALTGTTPFVAESALSTMIMHQSTTAPSLKEASLGTEFPEGLEQIVQSMLAKNPSNRYQTLHDAVKDLAAVGRGETLQHKPAQQRDSRSVHVTTKVSSIKLRRSLLMAIVLANLLLSAAFGTTLVNNWMTPRKLVVNDESEESNFIPLSNAALLFVQPIKQGRHAFEGKYLATDKSLAPFNNYDGVQSLEFDACQITDAGLAPLRRSKTIILIASNCAISEVKNISELNYLQRLDLTGTYIKDSDLAQLAKLKMLRELNLRQCDEITDDGLRQLIPSTSLSYVQLSSNKFSQRVLNELAQKMPQCTFDGQTVHSEALQILSNPKKLPPYRVNELACAALERINPKLTLIAELKREMSSIRRQEKNYSEAEALLKSARKLLEDNGNKVALADILNENAALACVQRHMKECDQYANEAANMFIDVMMNDDEKLMKRLVTLTKYAYLTKTYDNSIKNCKRAIAIIKQQSPWPVDSYLPTFTETIGNYYLIGGQQERALPFYRDLVALRKSNRGKDPQAYARALVELGSCESDKNLKKQACREALDLLDSLGHPAEGNLRELYCNACNDMIVSFDGENNLGEAIKYCRKGLTVANLIAIDAEGRKQLFQKQLISHLTLAGRVQEAKQESAAFSTREKQKLESRQPRLSTDNRE